MSSKLSEHEVIVTLLLNKKTPAGWLERGKAMNASIQAALQAPKPLLGPPQQPALNPFTILTTTVAAMDSAQSAAANHGTNEIGLRNVAWLDLRKACKGVKNWVQVLCDQAPDIATAQAIARAASLGTKVVTLPQKDDPHVKVVGNGAVHVFARVGPRVRAFFEWQQRLKNAADYTPSGNTNDGNILIQSLTVGSQMQFRYRKSVKNVPGPWIESKIFTIT